MTTFLSALLWFLTPAWGLDIARLDGSTVTALTTGGPVVALDLGPQDRPRSATAASFVKAPPQRVWAVINGFAAYPQWMPQVERAEVRTEGEAGTDVAFRLVFDFIVDIKVDYTLRYRRTGPHRLEFTQVEGDFDRNEGWFEIRPHEGGSLLYYSASVDYRSMGLLGSFLESQPTLELGLSSSSVAVIVRAVKRRAESVP